MAVNVDFDIANELNELFMAEKVDYSKFDEDQKTQIRLGIKSGVDVFLYTKLNEKDEPVYDADQMKQIRKGLESDIDITMYTDPSYSWETMEKIRKDLEDKAYARHYTVPGRDEFRQQVLDELKKTGIYTPSDIVSYLNKYVSGQYAAKKAAAMMLWNHLHGLKKNTMFIGPSGCGKTHIWRTLKTIPALGRLIHITDASDITQKGWRGSKKSDSILKDIYFGDFSGLPEFKPLFEISIIVFDEFDKLLAPSYSSGGDNVSYQIQAQFLTMIEGAEITLNNPDPDNSWTKGTVQVDTSDISFGFCGAFEELYKKKISDKKSEGFGFAGQQEDKEEDITIEDVIRFGARPELAGRISDIALLKPLTKSQIIDILSNPTSGPVAKYVNAYNITVNMSDRYMDKLASNALKSSMGVRALMTSVTRDIDSIIYEIRVDDYNNLSIDLDLDDEGNNTAVGHIKERKKHRKRSMFHEGPEY